MRQVGTIPNESDAHRFAAYLLTQGVTAHAEEDQQTWAIWVRDENHLEKAKEEIEEAVKATGACGYVQKGEPEENLLLKIAEVIASRAGR